jgi:hypothetical protein
MLAYSWGALVMLAHIYNFGNPRIVSELLPRDIRDIVYHGSMFAIFTLLFRFSLVTPLGTSAGRPRRLGAAGGYAADITALVVCCGWGALCELLQLRIPGREFHYEELALNMGVPLLVIALVGVASRRGD